ncbi:MAG TPA: hypothetical protein VGN97_12125 [Mesorhizobium sp.]|jgi:vacuolar-type H+-ATPase subunit E/Vma4|nr:hypothetical protein [Mesorhizobium sp.]
MSAELIERLRDRRTDGAHFLREDAAAEIERLTRERDEAWHEYTLLNGERLRMGLDVAEAEARAEAAQRDLREARKAALEELREPTEEQLRAAWAKVDYNIDDFWRAMFDERLRSLASPAQTGTGET